MSVELNTSLSNRGMTTDKSNKVESLQFQIDSPAGDYAEGKFEYDPDIGSHVSDSKHNDSAHVAAR